jgi:hypothetical protein
MKALYFTVRYLLIGILFGVGIYSVDFLYQKLYFEDKQVERIENLKTAVEDLVEQIYQPGYKSLWERLEEEHPEALLTFSLERYKLLDSSVQVSGKVENVGPGIFEGFLVEVEAFDKAGHIFAECRQFFQRIEPGESEAVIFDCPFSALDKNPELGEVSFRIKRKLMGKVAKDS